MGNAPIPKPNFPSVDDWDVGCQAERPHAFISSDRRLSWPIAARLHRHRLVGCTERDHAYLLPLEPGKPQEPEWDHKHEHDETANHPNLPGNMPPSKDAEQQRQRLAKRSDSDSKKEGSVDSGLRWPIPPVDENYIMGMENRHGGQNRHQHADDGKDEEGP